MAGQAEPLIEWMRAYLGTGGSVCVQQTADGGFIVSGDVLIRTSADGTEEWRSAAIDLLAGSYTYVCESVGGGYVTAGTTDREACDGGGKISLVRTDEAGALSWSRTFELELGGLGMEQPLHCSTSTFAYTGHDGRIVVVAQTLSADSSNPLGHLAAQWSNSVLKLDASGTKLWERMLSHWGAESAPVFVMGFEEQNDGGLALFLQEGTGQSPDTSFFTVTLNPETGMEVNRDPYDPSSPLPEFFIFSAPAAAITGAHDGSRIAAVSRDSGTSTGIDMYVACYSLAGELVWEVHVARDGNQVVTAVRKTAGGGYVVLGAEEAPPGEASTLLVRLSPAGSPPQDHSVSTPAKPVGSNIGRVDQDIAFTIAADSTCNQGHSMLYRLDWGHDEISEWDAIPVGSHAFPNPGAYEVRAQACCSSNISITSKWSQGLNVEIQGSSEPSSDFWARIVNAPQGRRLRREPEASTDSEIAKVLPDGWVLWVVDTHDNSILTSDGFVWWEVRDTTDDECTDCPTLWIAALQSKDDTAFLDAVTEDQQALRLAAAPEECDTLATRQATIVEALAHYYTAESGTSLYDGDGFEWMRATGFPAKVVLAMFAVESEIVNYDNSWVSFDHGHGVGQITLCSSCKHPFDNRGVSSGVWLEECTYSPSQQMPVLNSTGTYLGRAYDQQRYYSNTRQSIYSNVKDALYVLSRKYSFVTQYLADDVIGAMRGAVWAYNAGEGAACGAVDVTSCQRAGYLKCVIGKLTNLDLYFPGYESVLFDGLPQQDIDLQRANLFEFQSITAWTEGAICSPPEIRVVDANELVTGEISGVVEIGIPDSLYLYGDFIVFGDTELRFDVMGLTGGTYSLKATRVTDYDTVRFSADGLTIPLNGTHSFTFAWEQIGEGEESVLLRIDYDGDGVFENSFTGDGDTDWGTVTSDSVGGSLVCDPNPTLASGTALFYSLPWNTSFAEVLVFTASGHFEIRVPLEIEASRFPATGFWIPTDQAAEPLQSGAYLCILVGDGRVIARTKLVIPR